MPKVALLEAFAELPDPRRSHGQGHTQAREHPNLARRPKKGKIIREVPSRIMGGLYEWCP
jgi:hypothetical protein